MQTRTGNRADFGRNHEAGQRGALLSVRLARTWDEVEAAQRLRWRVFAQEMGARLGGSPGVDQDRFDDHCDHLIVVDQGSARVVGTYRILPPAGALRLGEHCPRPGGRAGEGRVEQPAIGGVDLGKQFEIRAVGAQELADQGGVG